MTAAESQCERCLALEEELRRRDCSVCAEDRLRQFVREQQYQSTIQHLMEENSELRAARHAGR